MAKAFPEWITEKAVNFVIKRLKNVDPNTKRKLETALRQEASEYASGNTAYDYNALVERLETRVPESMYPGMPSSQGYVVREVYSYNDPIGQPRYEPRRSTSYLYPSTSSQSTSYRYQTISAAPSSYGYQQEIQLAGCPCPGSGYGQPMTSLTDDRSWARSSSYGSFPSQFQNLPSMTVSSHAAPSYPPPPLQFRASSGGGVGGCPYSTTTTSSSNPSTTPWTNSQTPVQCPFLNASAPPISGSPQPPSVVKYVYTTTEQGDVGNPYVRSSSRIPEAAPVNCSDDERWAEGKIHRMTILADGTEYEQSSRKLKGCLKKPREEVEFTVNHPYLPIGARLPRDMYR